MIGIPILPVRMTSENTPEWMSATVFKSSSFNPDSYIVKESRDSFEWMPATVFRSGPWPSFNPDSYTAKESQDALETVVRAVNAEPQTNTALSLKVYLSYNRKNWKDALDCEALLLADPSNEVAEYAPSKSESYKHKKLECIFRKHPNGVAHDIKNTEESGQYHGMAPDEIKRAAESQMRLPEVVAIILILTPEYEEDPQCIEEVHIAVGTHKVHTTTL